MKAEIVEYAAVGGLSNLGVFTEDADVLIRPRSDQVRARRFAEWVASIEETHQALADARLALRLARERVGLLAGAHEQVSMFGTAVVREDAAGAVWVMDSSAKGWSAFGLRFRDWAELAAERPEWRPCGVGADDTGPFVRLRCLGGWPEARIKP